MCLVVFDPMLLLAWHTAVKDGKATFTFLKKNSIVTLLNATIGAFLDSDGLFLALLASSCSSRRLRRAGLLVPPPPVLLLAGFGAVAGLVTTGTSAERCGG
jgi:hypothetical protein